jgi:hypothetical protein
MTPLDFVRAMFAACLLMLAVSVWHWPRSQRKEVLAAIMVMVTASLVRETVPEFVGMNAWPDWAVQAVAACRAVTIVGMAMFVRAVTKDRCGEKGWLVFAIIVIGYAVFR